MRWAEVIRVRTQPDREQEVARGLAEVMDTLDGPSDLCSATLYGRAAVPSDLSLHLEWDTASVPDAGSELALSIVRELQPLGLLYHLLLVEQRRYSRPEARPKAGRASGGQRPDGTKAGDRADRQKTLIHEAGNGPANKKGET